ncbi:MAG: hypothetical protein LBQ68_09950 [Clostridiales bacterium]|jgi:hypothetical protein|nr:hypothetical protein [Clostridiales bacterium]
MPREDRIYSGDYLDLPCDYAKLIEAGVIVAAVRDDIPKSEFSSTLLERQKHNKHSDLPSKRYTKTIQELYASPQASIKQFRLSDVAGLFETKAREFLRTPHTGDVNFDKIRQRLLSDIGYMKQIDLNGLLTRLETYGFSNESSIYQAFKVSFAKCYNNNVPQSLNLNYQAVVGDTRIALHEDNGIPLFDYGVSQRYVFDIDCLAYIPSSELINALTLSERYEFVRQFNLYQSGNSADNNALISAYECYIRRLDKFFRDCFTRKTLAIVRERPERPLYIKIISSVAFQMITIGLGAVPLTYGFSLALSAASVATLYFINRQEEREKIQEIFEKRLADLSERSVIISKAEDDYKDDNTN